MGKVRRVNEFGDGGEEKRNELELTAAEKTINQRIANLRKTKRLTQKEFAEKLNVSDKLVSKWEQEDNTPALEYITKICTVFNISLDYLIKGEKSESDAEALRPLPPPLPPFADPIQTLIKTIEGIITENKLQKFKERIFPGSSEEVLYTLVERIRKDNLEEWKHVEFDRGTNAHHYKEKYAEDLRSRKKLIDEKYWGQVVFQDHYIYGGPKYDESLLKCGVFIIDEFSSFIKKISNDDEYRMTDYNISFSINFDALLALDNFEVYSKLTSSGIPLKMNVLVPARLKKTSGYFDLTFEEIKYYEIFEKIYKAGVRIPLMNTISGYLRCMRGEDYSYNRSANRPKTFKEYSHTTKDEYIYRDLNKAPLTYNELLGSTDVRFFGLLPKDELDILLEKVNLKHKRVWEVVLALIDSGATKKKLIEIKKNKYERDFEEADDALATLMLYEFAKMKTDN